MMNSAIEDARDFSELINKIKTDAESLRREVAAEGAPDELRYTMVPNRQPGENRAAHRARLKRERREAKARKVPA